MAKKTNIPDLRFIDGIRIDTLLAEYRETKKEALLRRIVRHFTSKGDVLRDRWALELWKAQGKTATPSEALKMHDEIVEQAVKRFNGSWPDPNDDNRFNTYLVRTFVNRVRTMVLERKATENYPRTPTPLGSIP